MYEARRNETLQAPLSNKALADTSKMVKHSEILGQANLSYAACCHQVGQGETHRSARNSKHNDPA